MSKWTRVLGTRGSSISLKTNFICSVSAVALAILEAFELLVGTQGGLNPDVMRLPLVLVVAFSAQHTTLYLSTQIEMRLPCINREIIFSLWVKMLTSDFPKFCPKKDCSCYQSLNNKITLDGTKKLKEAGERRQMYYCHGGKHRFSETAYSKLGRKQGSLKEYIQTAKLSTYGLSAEQIADVLERDIRTIEDWLGGIAEKSQRFHESICLIIGITLQFLQMDELWSYLKKKKRQLWVFLALDPSSKFWINFELGSRTNHTANRLVKNLKALVAWDYTQVLKVTTDKLAAYKNEERKTIGRNSLCLFANRQTKS